jgi:hypothetical protein
LRSCGEEEEARDWLEGPGLGGRELLLSESADDRLSRPVLDFDWVDLDRRIWLCRRLSGGVGGRFCSERLRWRVSDSAGGTASPAK